MQIKTIDDAVVFRDDKMAKVNLFETGRFFCDLYCLRPGQAQKMHSHADNDKVYFVLEGEARVSVGDDSGPLHQGEGVLAPAGVPHGIANQSEENLVCLVFMAPHPSH